MSRWSTLGTVVGGGILLVVGSTPGCGSGNDSQFNGTGDDGGMFGSTSSGGSSGFTGSSGASSGGGEGGTGTNPYGMTAGAVCPQGAMCNVACSGGATTTTISGTVHDPSGKNPLYGISVYVPGGPLQPLPQGVPMGKDACSCGALFKSGAITSTTTDVQGHFSLANAPVGANIPLVIQVGKWRHVVSVTTTSCTDNPQSDVSMTLNGTVAPGSQDNMPDIAVSTGHADTLECLMKRIGLPDSEYVAGTATGGHVHVFSGGQPGGGGGGGNPEVNPMPNAPESDTNLWDSAAHLLAFDILLLSCEGGETYNANPQVLESYLNAGGRAFASHFHYAWFNTAPPDWGNNLATWAKGGGTAQGPDNGVIVQTLNVGGGPFVKGQMLDQWLGVVAALGTDGVPAGDLAIFAPRYNAVVGPANKPSQPWITDMRNGTNQTMYFSFDTPVNAAANAYCGRAVFSDLHVSGCSMSGATCNIPYVSAMDSANFMGGQAPPGGCIAGGLSPQEKVLEFMLFDLSSCVISDMVPPPTKIPVVN
jgi:hypothetical protein